MKTRKTFKLCFLLFAVLFVVTLTSCNACGGGGYANKYLEAANSDGAVKELKVNQVAWTINTINETKKTYMIDNPDLTELEATKNAAKAFINDYPNYKPISGKSKDDEIEKNYKVILIKSDIVKYTKLIDNATEFTIPLKEGQSEVTYESIETSKYTNAIKTSSSCFSAQTNTDAQKMINDVENNKNINDIAVIFTLQVTERTQEGEPLHFYASSFGDFIVHIFNNLLIFPVGWLLYAISKLMFGQYIIGLVITTLIVRTIGWPIYAKTNDMSLKMKAIEPEVQKLQAKYANRKDPDSQRMMQMEQARLYKQNGIGIGGCLMPLLQFPIFLAIFRAVSRLPYTVRVENTIYNLNWGAEINSKFLGLDLFKDYTAGTGQLIWIIVLVILVSGTQFLSQLLSEKRQKKAKEKTEEDVPAYRRQAANQQANETQKTMKLVMYMMIFMMAVFVWTSKAGLGVYWLIGNVYSMGQMYVNARQSEKKLEKLKEKQRYK